MLGVSSRLGAIFMGDVINLRLHRKRKERADREEKAEANRAKFGRTKAEKQTTQAVLDLSSRRLEGHKREQPEPEPEGDM